MNTTKSTEDNSLMSRNLLPFYFIHYTPLGDRFLNIQNIVKSFNIEGSSEIVRAFDAEELSVVSHNTDFSKLIWNQRILDLKPYLLSNTYFCQENNSLKSYIDIYKHFSSSTETVPEWMHYRCLKTGEISVLFKHFYALMRIANGTESHGIICEDDILLHKQSLLNLSSIISCLDDQVDYIDLAGGANLKPCNEFELNNNIKNKNLAKLVIPRTRTNASYLISRRAAKIFVANYFPLVFPIDWHLQYILNLHVYLKCFWAIDPVFIHGSETSHFNSWRDY